MRLVVLPVEPVQDPARRRDAVDRADGQVRHPGVRRLSSLGERIAVGASAEIYEFGSGRVVKLFFPEYAYIAASEAEATAAVHAAGVAAPEAFGLVDVDGRPGLVLERIDGSVFVPAAELAQIHLALHEASPARLPSWRDRVAQLLSTLDEEAAAAYLDLVEKVPDGAQLYHGDLHPMNVIRSARGPVVVDWQNACLAHPAADVARSIVLIKYQGVIPGDEDGSRRHAYGDEYATAYLAAGTIDDDQLRPALAMHASALLRYEPGNVFAGELRALTAR